MLEEVWIYFGEQDMYRISSKGRLQTRFLHKGMRGALKLADEYRDKKLKKSKTDKHGGWYLTFSKDGVHIRLHRFMWEMFRGPIEKGYVINHKDGDRANCAIDNLEMVTQKENIQNLIDRGNYKLGKRGIAR